MNILFLTIVTFDNLDNRNIYSDLMREFVDRGHNVFIAQPLERRHKQSTKLIKSEHCQILKIKTLNIQKTNVVEKGIGTLLLEYQFLNAIYKYWRDINFDLIIYSTPPITFNKVITSIKKRCGCRSYLMLKDIFPQNAVDLGMMREKSLIHKMFRRKEKELYAISDRIGCMSPANCEYVIRHNPEIDKEKVELCPNAVDEKKIPVAEVENKKEILEKYQIPDDKIIYIYGGNLGKPQGIDFLMEVLEMNENRTDSFIIIVGSGTEYPTLEKWFENHKPKNSKLFSSLPKNDYDNFVRCCNVGLIFLDSRFTIPNFPSRLLSYIENKMPVLLATDQNTDMGRIAQREGFGYSSISGDIKSFAENMDKISVADLKEMGRKGYEYMLENYTVSKEADNILKQ